MQDAKVVPPIPRLVGWLLIAPAAVLFLLSYVLLTVDLLRKVPWGDDRLWEFVASSQTMRPLGSALSFALLPLMILATVAPALAWAASRAGLAGRRVVRAALALPLVAFAPTGLAVVWASRHVPGFRDISRVEVVGWLAMASMLGGFVFAVAVTCYLSALRRRDPDARTGPALTTVGVLLALVTLAAAVQVYTFVAVLEGPVFEVTPTPMVLLESGGVVGRPHTAITVLPILMALGVAAALVMLRTGLRLEFDPTAVSADDRHTAPGVRRAALIGSAVGVAALVLFIVVQLGPWLAAMVAGDARLPAGFAASSVLFTTWLVPLGTAIVQVGAAALAAFGIAVVRPMGRASEWLLLVFAPWLLVGNGLLAASAVNPLERPPGIQPLITYGPPSWLSVPALFVFVLLFRGQAVAWSRLRAAGAPNAFARAMWPAVPMLVLGTGVAWLIQAQDLLVPRMADQGLGVVPNGQLLAARSVLPMILGPNPDPGRVVGLGYPVALLVVFTLGAVAFQLAYLDRIAVRRGPDE